MRYPRIRVRKIWEIPPRPPRLRKGYWDSVIRDVLPLKEDEALKLPFSEGCSTEGMESSARKAARRAGIRISVAVRGTTMYLWVAARTKTRRNKSASASKE